MARKGVINASTSILPPRSLFLLPHSPSQSLSSLPLSPSPSPPPFFLLAVLLVAPFKCFFPCFERRAFPSKNKHIRFFFGIKVCPPPPPPFAPHPLHHTHTYTHTRPPSTKGVCVCVWVWERRVKKRIHRENNETHQTSSKTKKYGSSLQRTPLRALSPSDYLLKPRSVLLPPFSPPPQTFFHPPTPLMLPSVTASHSTLPPSLLLTHSLDFRLLLS